MTTENLDKLNLTFRLNSIRREGLNILKGQERKDFANIAKKFDKQRTSSEQLYRAEYKTRVEVARRALIDKAGSKTREFKPSFGMIDRFNSKDITRQAQLNVRQDYQQSMDRLDSQELKQSEGFLGKCSQRKEYLKRFKQATDRRRPQTRRQDIDRRSPSPTMSD